MENIDDKMPIKEENMFYATPIQKKLFSIKDGENVEIKGTICPVHNATCLYYLEIKFIIYYMDDDPKNDHKIYNSVWLCPWSCNEDNCKLNK